MRSRLRRAAARAAEAPLLGGALRLLRRTRWARTILASGVVDAEFAAAQLGRPGCTERAAVRHYLRGGHSSGFSLAPLFDETVAGRELPGFPAAPALYSYLVNGGDGVRTHPWAAASRGGLRPAADDRIVVGFAGVLRELSYAEFRALALAAARGEPAIDAEPDAARGAALPSERLIVADFAEREVRFDDRLRRLFELADAAGAELRISPADVGSLPRSLRELEGILGRPLTLQRHTGVVGAARAAAALGASWMLLLGERVELDAEGAAALLLASAETPVVPALIASDGVVEEVGALDTSRGLVPVLSGHPERDLDGLGAFPVDAVCADAVAGPVELLLRAEDAHGRLRLAALAQPGIRARRAVERDWLGPPPAQRALRVPSVAAPPTPADAALGSVLATAGMTLRGWDDASSPVVTPTAGATPRWAVKTSAPAGPRGAVWGDRHFALGLADALGRAGVRAVVDDIEAADRPSSVLDEVTVVVRGPHRLSPPPTGTSILWIISHPDEITAEELDDFDAVFAASRSWSVEASRRFGRSIEPLLECTDATRFRPRGLPRGPDIVFVGTSRGMPREVVVAPVQAGVPVRVYGPDWREYLPGESIVASSLPNDELAERYETASIVLNDHWPAMRAAGFMAMRPFDAVAAGGRVISDEVEGLEQLFGGAVRCYRDRAELLRLLGTPADELFPDEAELGRISDRIRAEHSFDARAATLLAAALLAAARSASRPG